EVIKLKPAEGAQDVDGWLAVPTKDGKKLIVQWGRIRVDYSGEHSAYAVLGGSVSKYIGERNFPITFPNSVINIITSSNDVINTYIASAYPYSAGKFTWSLHSTTAYVSSSGGGNSFCWFAIGY
ncbi:gp53-like domain-containing protein, partial [Enterobacter hormaechei]